HNSNFFSDKLVLTSVTPASSAPVLQTPKATSSTLYFDSLTVNAGNGGFLHCIQMDTSVNAANQVVSVGADKENIINGVERPVKAAELFAFTLRVRAGNTDVLTDAEENVRQKLRAEGVM